MRSDLTLAASVRDVYNGCERWLGGGGGKRRKEREKVRKEEEDEKGKKRA